MNYIIIADRHHSADRRRILQGIYTEIETRLSQTRVTPSSYQADEAMIKNFRAGLGARFDLMKVWE